ncbi:hypothetical protein [Tropicibacter alexandrii]|uniref:hypothetical protein n=1 Tax=Tropicibacter alexandrii TaxID=2267683 RepID=UPI001008D8A6|nr:hypothetical protein [Tropicibacter alexandrii]
MTPTDHLPKTLPDRTCIRREEEIERRKSLFRQAKATSTGLRTALDQQYKRGSLTRADHLILTLMIRQNLRACVRKELFYRPTRKGLARASGYSQRTVSTSLARLKAAGLVVAVRYAKGGRLGDKGHGLATEWRSGCLQLLPDQLAALGYRLSKSFIADLRDLAAWAAHQVGQHTETKADIILPAPPTGKKLPGTLVGIVKRPLRQPHVAPVEASVGRVALLGDDPPALPFVGVIRNGDERAGSLRHADGLQRPALGRLAKLATGMARHSRKTCGPGASALKGGGQ